MPPKNKASTDSLKQKSLMTWFSKDAEKVTKAQSSSKNANATKNHTSSGDLVKKYSRGELLPPSSSPESRKSLVMDDNEGVILSNTTHGNGTSSPAVSSREGTAPPTSDLIDVDMLRIEDDEDQDGERDPALQIRRVEFFFPSKFAICAKMIILGI